MPAITTCMSDSERLTPVLVRLPPETLKQLDEYVDARNATGNGARISRNGAVKVLLELALQQQEAASAPRAPAKKVAGRR